MGFDVAVTDEGQVVSGLIKYDAPVESMNVYVMFRDHTGSLSESEVGVFGLADGCGLPARGVVYGDPHFVSYDGTAFDFQGKGEFAILRSTGLDVDARFAAAGAASVTSGVASSFKNGGTGESHVVAVTRDESNPESGLPLVRVQALPGGEWSVVDVSSLAAGAGSVTPLPGLTVGYIREGAGSEESAQFLGFEPKVPLASSASDLGGLIGMPAPSDPYDAAYVASIAVSSSPLFAPGVGVVPEQSIPASAADVAALTLAGYPDAAVEQARAACASFVISTEL